jgi:hypothetical protein
MVSIQVSDDIAAALAERAKHIGLSVEELLSTVAGHNSTSTTMLSGPQLEQILRTESAAHPVSISPSGTFDRAELYRDHD